METETERFLARWSMAAYRARCFIQGTIVHPVTRQTEPHSAHWSQTFLDHPTVQLAESEGWSKDLRGVVFLPVRRRIMAGQTCDNLNEVMPDEKWIRETRQRVAIERDAAEWQAANPHRFDRRVSSFKPLEVTRKPMAEMQSDSRNQYLHLKPVGLSDRSKAMAGD